MSGRFNVTGYDADGEMIENWPSWAVRNPDGPLIMMQGDPRIETIVLTWRRDSDG